VQGVEDVILIFKVEIYSGWRILNSFSNIPDRRLLEAMLYEQFLRSLKDFSPQFFFLALFSCGNSHNLSELIFYLTV
jgi:HJR/Mrr/RecB family endonuclease